MSVFVLVRTSVYFKEKGGNDEEWEREGVGGGKRRVSEWIKDEGDRMQRGMNAKCDSMKTVQ